jgi:hypothetical protein
MSIGPTRSSTHVAYPQGQRSISPRTPQNSLTRDSIRSSASEDCFSAFFSKIFQWIKKTFPCFFASTPTTNLLTAQELEMRIQKGREFINNNIDHHLGNSERNLHRDKFLVVVSYNNASIVLFPSTRPINPDQLKRDAVAKFETMMQQPNNQEHLECDYVMVTTYSFARQIRPSDGALSPFIRCESKQHTRCFGRNDTGDRISEGGIWRLYNEELSSWLHRTLPSSSPASEREAAISHASEAIHW